MVARAQLVLDNHGPAGANLGRNDVSAEIAHDDFTLGQFQVNTDCFCHQVKIFDEPRRGIQGVGVVDHPSYTEFLYRAWLLSERCPWPLLTKVSRLHELLDEGVGADIKRIPGLRWRLVLLVWNLWSDYHMLDGRLFSYRRLLGRLCYLASFGLARRPYIMNGRRWGLGEADDLLDREPALFLD